MSTPVARSLLIPGYAIACKRCGEETVLACDCRPLRLPADLLDKPLGAAKDLDRATAHEAGCTPPDRCPRCRATRWWLAPLPRSGKRTWDRKGGRPAKTRLTKILPSV